MTHRVLPMLFVLLVGSAPAVAQDAPRLPRPARPARRMGLPDDYAAAAAEEAR